MINVRKFTISDTGLLKDELFALSEIHANQLQSNTTESVTESSSENMS